MAKREAEVEADSHSRKKHKHKHSSKEHHPDSSSLETDRNRKGDSAYNFDEAVAQLPDQSSMSGTVPAYVPFDVRPGFPSLPELLPGLLSTAPFKHRSTGTYDRSVSASSAHEDLTYERLEFMGDAYLELIATRLIFERFGGLPVGRQSQLRELLVKNETLCEFSVAYGFDKRFEEQNRSRLSADTNLRGNKGSNKILADVFEAYVAAVVLSDAEHGFATAEKWLTALWVPKLVEFTRSDSSYAAARSIVQGADVNASKVYDPTAKAELQKRVGSDKNTIQLIYEPYRDSIELKGDQIGQSRHFIALYLTGYGYQRRLLGKGQGKNKVEAGNWAATEAMHGECKTIVDECAEKLRQKRAERDATRAAVAQ